MWRDNRRSCFATSFSTDLSGFGPFFHFCCHLSRETPFPCSGLDPFLSLILLILLYIFSLPEMCQLGLFSFLFLFFTFIVLLAVGMDRMLCT